MGLNAQTSVPTFTASQVLTAQQQNWINTGIPVFATTTTRDAAFGGTGEKTLAQGQYAYIEATSTLQVYTGSAWIAASNAGLVLTGSATVTASQTGSLDNCFNSTYQNYRIVLNISALTGANTLMSWRLRTGGVAATTNYTQIRALANAGTMTVSTDPSGTDDWYIGSWDGTYPTRAIFTADILSPNEARATTGTALQFNTASTGGLNLQTYGFTHTTATAYDGLQITTDGTNWTGLIRVYGYANS